MESINLIKEAELKAENTEKNARDTASLIIEKAKRESEGIIESKIKEALTKSNLRINFAKNEAKEHMKKISNETANEILALKASVKEKELFVRDLIIKEIVGE